MIQESKVIGLWPQRGASSGFQLLIEWYGCGARRALVEDHAQLRRLCLRAVEAAGMPIVDHLFCPRTPAGVVGTLLLADSHLAIHTWPDEQSVFLDVFVGSPGRDHRPRAHAIYSLLKEELMPNRENVLRVNRYRLVHTVAKTREPAAEPLRDPAGTPANRRVRTLQQRRIEH
jgi:S-adenosylmethionine decarboxylase